MNNQYKKTITACFVGYIVQAIVNNFVPLLFLVFQRTYGIPLSQITLSYSFMFLIPFLSSFSIFPSIPQTLHVHTVLR